MSYVIRNCPAYDYDEEFNYHICKQPLIPNECSVDDCQDCTDCVMKRVIGKCIELYNMECKNPYKTNGYMLAFDILKEMNIQEVE